MLLPFIALAWPLTYVPAYLNLPPINDVSTDFADPPQFLALAKQRKGDANPVAYPGARFAAAQQKAYPELRSFVVDRPAEEAFELVEEAVRKLKWRVAASEPPATGRGAKPGMLEATDTTLVVGFTDDIVVRVEGSVNRSRIDVRSASRYGAHDLGDNATRVRRFFAELQTRIDSTSPASPAGARPAHDPGRRDGQESERTRSGESGGSQRTSPRSIKCSTWARTERDAALRSLGSRPL